MVSGDGSLLDLPTKPGRHGGNIKRVRRRKSTIKYQAGVLLLSTLVRFPNLLDTIEWIGKPCQVVIWIMFQLPASDN